MGNILVVGSSNTDMVVKTQRFPSPGETVVGGDFYLFQGGKGANQAVAASRLGGKVTFVSKVGKDLFGEKTKKSLEAENILSDWILEDLSAPSGIALITVNGQGENQILVAPGANNTLSSLDIQKVFPSLPSFEIALCQLEIPLETVTFLAKNILSLGKKLILNPAPAQVLPDMVYQKLFLITPNETEATLLSGIPCDSPSAYSQIATWFRKKGVQNVLITLGEKGSYFQNSSMEFLTPANQVQAVDTTAAGDVFNGSLAVALAEEMSWKKALSFASKAASISVTRMGAQASAPYRREI
ncbi:MAG: hypothetical protein RL407_2018 [Bacteroidota bacterium]|jgi:ribokinase